MKKMIITNSNDPKIEYRNEYDYLEQVYYLNKPFTGKIIDKNEETEYHNGTVCGEYIRKYDDGTIREHEFYDNGEFIKAKHYHPNGLLKYENNRVTYYKKWDLKGNLICEFSNGSKCNYYSNGNIQSISLTNNDSGWSFKFFTEDNKLMYSKIRLREDKESQPFILYDHELMFERYFELLNIEKRELIDDESIGVLKTGMDFIWDWLWYLFDQDQQSYFDIVNKLLCHPNEGVVDRITRIIVLHNFQPYINKENTENQKAYKLIKIKSKNISRSPHFTPKKVTL